jgi:phage terminase Nu1 subunit (DNA packaging protein)
MKSLDDRVPGPVIAGMLGISVVSFHQLVGKGVVERQGRAGYPLRDTVKACCEYYRKIAGGRSEEGEQKVLASARARAALAQAEQMELRTQIARSKYVPVDALRYALNDMTITCRQQLLLNIPTAVVNAFMQRWPQLEGVEMIFDLVDDAVRDVLTQYAEGVVNLTADPPSYAAEAVKLARARRWRGPTPQGISHDRNQNGDEASASGDFASDAFARSRRADGGLEPGSSNGLAPRHGRDQRRNGIALSTR